MTQTNKNIEFWNRTAVSTSSVRRAFAGMLMEGAEFESIYRCKAEQSHFLNLTGITKSLNVLEVGSGGGRWGLFLADLINSYVGLDISASMVAIAEADRAEKNLKNVRYECLRLLDFKTDSKFDLIYFSGVLQYMDDNEISDSIAVADSLLTNSGIIISRDSIQTEKRVEKTGDYPVIYRTESEYQALFKAAGFELDYSNLSYQHKRFTQIASSFFRVPGVTYRLAYNLRELMCTIDNLFKNPRILKRKKFRSELDLINKQEHRFFRYIKK